jgi:uncharacterized protein with HEPN domain
MQPDPRDSGYLLDMLEAAQKILRYLQGKNFQDYQGDSLLQDGVERNLEIIGEAARKVSEPFKQAHPEIPWRKMIAQRNVLIHEYEDIKNEEVWEVITIHLPALITQLEPLIPPLPPDVGLK